MTPLHQGITYPDLSIDVRNPIDPSTDECCRVAGGVTVSLQRQITSTRPHILVRNVKSSFRNTEYVYRYGASVSHCLLQDGRQSRCNEADRKRELKEGLMQGLTAELDEGQEKSGLTARGAICRIAKAFLARVREVQSVCPLLERRYL